MPRGNTKDNIKNSPVIGDAGVSATPEELRQITRHAIEVFQSKAPDLHNPEEVERAIFNYFESCDRHGIRPGNLGLYAYLGMSKQEVSNVLMGKTPNKVSPACIDLIKKAKVTMSAYREALALSGKLSPPVAIFWGKNFDQMEDYTRIEIETNHAGPVTITAEEARAALLEDKPIDAPYKITETGKE